MAYEVDKASMVTSNVDVGPIEPPSMTLGMWVLLELGAFLEIT